jgi:hypothetical protein
MAKKKKRYEAKDPNKYVWALEKGLEKRNIPARPIVQPTFEDYTPVFIDKVNKARQAMLRAWK